MSNNLEIRRRLKNIIKDASPGVVEYTTLVLGRNINYFIGDRVRPTPYLAYTYRCDIAGKSGSTTPTMKELGTILDGTVRWIEDSDSYDFAIQAAIDVFSHHNPAKLRAAITGVGKIFTLPDEWINEFSQIIQIEYPLEQIPSKFLEQDQFELYQSDSESWKLIIYADTVDESLGLYFTGLRSPISIPEELVEAFTWLCASLWFAKLANSYISSTDSSISIDTVDYKDKVAQFKEQAKYFMAMYKDFIGVPYNQEAACYIGRTVSTYPYNIERLTHPRIERYTR